VGLAVAVRGEAGGPFVGMDELTFPQPVYPGDTLTASSTVIAVRESQSRPAFGIVTWHTEGRNQRGDIVVDYKRSNLVGKKRGELL
jgi:acyl dehydratase